MGRSTLLWAVLVGAVVLALLCGVLGWMLLTVLKRMTINSLPVRLAVNRLLHQPWSTLSQLSAFSLSFMLLALLLVLRGDLLDRWQQQLPPESPNYFLINIAPEQVTPLKGFLSEHHIIPESFYPIVRARLTQINGQSTEGNKDESLNRELNLTAGEAPGSQPDHRRKLAAKGRGSVDGRGLAKRLNVKLGDSVTFTGDTQDFSARVTSLRKVDWESLRPSFFFIFPVGALDGQPQSWLTSFRWENGNGMLTQQPGIPDGQPAGYWRDTETGQSGAGAGQPRAGGDGGTGDDLRRAVAAGTGAGWHASASSGAGGLPYAGSGKRLLRATLWASSPCWGWWQAVAAIGAEAALAVLQSKVFDFPWEPDWRLWLTLPVCGALLLSLCGGWLGARLLKGKALFRQFVS